MISKHELIDYIFKNQDVVKVIYNKEDDRIYYKDTGELVGTADEFLSIYRSMTGQSFDLLDDNYEDSSITVQCNTCGTVIFVNAQLGDHSNLRCPTCTGFHTNYIYWTKEQIDSSEEKQYQIDLLKKLHKEQQEVLKKNKERKLKRNGKEDWEIFNKEFKFKTRYFYISLQCDDVTKSYFKGLRLYISCGKKSKYEIDYTPIKSKMIPLSISYARVMRKERKQNKLTMKKR